MFQCIDEQPEDESSGTSTSDGPKNKGVFERLAKDAQNVSTTRPNESNWSGNSRGGGGRGSQRGSRGGHRGGARGGQRGGGRSRNDFHSKTNDNQEADSSRKMVELHRKVLESEEETRKAKEENDKLKAQLKGEKEVPKNASLKLKPFDIKCSRCELDLGITLRESARYAGYFTVVKKGEQP